MGIYQAYKGDPEGKKFYLIDQLVGGLNTEFSDDNSSDREFANLVNFEMDTQGSLNKRLGFGKLNAVSEIFNLFENLPTVMPKTPENPHPELTNDNIVYMKLLKNDNNVFRVLSSYSTYRDYQKVLGVQENSFEILIITTNYNTNTSTAWLYTVELPALEVVDGVITDTDTIVITEEKYDLPVLFKWDKNLMNIETIEFFDKIYFTNNDKALVVFDRNTNTFIYNGKDVAEETNTAYKPNAMEIRKVGFNLLGDDPLYWVNYQGISTDSIQGMYITTMDDKPSLVIPNGGKFRINVLYTGETNNTFTFEFKEGDRALTFTATLNTTLSKTGLKVYDITINEVPTTEIEIKITKNSASIDPYYDYYQVDVVDPDAKEVTALNVGECGILEMYNRAVYYKEDTIYFSEINIFDYVPNYNYVSLPLEPTDKITKIVFFKNVYIIFTKYSIYKMIGQFGTPDFQVLPVNLSIGCHAPNTVVHVENELYFTSPLGFYLLKSSDFRDGIENLKELDTKVKSLTRDKTLFLGKIDDPAIRSVAIGERAYAMRYKDKYMLFYNNAYESEDFVSEDVLVYKYEMKAFTQFRFPVKPTFLFMAENAITTFATVPLKEEFTEEETVFEYDFTEGTSNTITDKGANGLDGTLVNGYLQPGIGIRLADVVDYAKLGNVPENVDILPGFSIDVDTKCNTLGYDSTLFDLGQSIASSAAGPTSGSFFTNWLNGYRSEFIFNTTPDAVNNRSLVNYTVKLYRDSTSRNAAQSGTFNLKEGTNTLIANRNFTFNFGSALVVTVATGTFVINHDTTGNYSKNWTFNLATRYPTYSTGYTKGPTKYFDTRKPGNFSTLFGIRFVGRAEAYDWGAKVYIRPYVSLQKYASLYVGSRAMYTWVNGNQKNHTAPAISTDGSNAVDVACNEQTININYSGQPTIPIDGRYNIRATISGVYRENLDVDAFNFTLPSVTAYTITTWNDFTVSGSKTVTLDKISTPSKRSIFAIFHNDGTLKVGANTEFNNTLMTINNVIDTNRHLWKFVFTNTGTSYRVNVYKDGTDVGIGYFPLNTIKNALRDSCLLGKSNANYGTYKGEYYYFKMSLLSGVNIMEYDFVNGRGTNITDISGNGRNGTLYNSTWLVENGLKFNGDGGYISIPEIDASYQFSNGFAIEFEAKVKDVAQIAKVIDLATSYNSGASSNQKCSINVGIDVVNKLIDVMSTSVDLKSYKLSKSDVDLTGKHIWKVSCTDNGNGYTMKIYCDTIELASADFNYGGITNVTRKSNFIGRSNNPSDGYFKGMLYNIKVTINASANPVPVYVGALYEYDTTYDDFGRPMYIELESKGTNMRYPLHEKKLKNIFVKGLGGYNYVDFLCFIKADGHLINNPYIYECYIEPITQQIVYEYAENRELKFNEKLSVLGNMRLDNTRLGESTYETRKLVARGKGKNFSIKIQGESSDPLKIESFGYVFKIGKVKE
jgi:hypothetical protein